MTTRYPEPPVMEPDPVDGYCDICDGWPCVCDRAYDAYRDSILED